MGEESAGFDSVRIAHSRIGAGQSEIALVGGSHNGERPDMLMLYEFGGLTLKNKLSPVWERGSDSRRLRAGLAWRIPRHRGTRSRRKAWRKTLGPPLGRRLRPRQPAARHDHGDAFLGLWDRLKAE